MSKKANVPLWRHLVGTLSGVFLGVVLLVATWAKVLDPSAFAREITRQGLDFLLPASAVALLALALEAGLGTALFLAIRRWWILLPTGALVAFFLFLTGRDYWRWIHGDTEVEASCGCFGNLVQRTPAEAFWQDLLLMVPALLLAAILGHRAHRRLPWVRLALVALVTGATLLLAWWAPDLPLDDLATRLRPGVETENLCAGQAEDGTQVCMSALVPELAQGPHLVILSALDEADLLEAMGHLNEHHLTGQDPLLWLLTAADEATLFDLRWGPHAPSFEIREAPEALLKPLYRTLPRAFLVEDGQVTTTYRDLAAALAEVAPGHSGQAQAMGSS